MGNLSFAHNAGFSWYCILLMLSGIAMLVTAVLRNQAVQRRVIRAIFGIGFFCYGFYLTFVFAGGHYVLFFQAFIVPVLLILDTIRSQASRRRLRQGVRRHGRLRQWQCRQWRLRRRRTDGLTRTG